MDISKILNYSALFVAIATCAFVFLMYKRVTARLDGLTQAQLGLSRTLQHMVSASLGNPPGAAGGAGVVGGAMVASEAPGSNCCRNRQLVPSDQAQGSDEAVRRITVSDDDVSSGSYESESESESGDDITVSSEDGLTESGSESESEDEAIEYDVPKVVQLAETGEISLDGGLVSVGETLGGIQPSDRIEEVHAVHAIKIESAEADEEMHDDDDDDSDADSNASQDSEDLKVIDDIILDTEQDSDDEEGNQAPIQDESQPEEAEIKVPAHSDEYIEHVKHAKVEELRKLVVDKNIMDEAKAKNTKKKALVDLLIQ